jgi:D-alanyl-D-alanine carboxypeptidase
MYDSLFFENFLNSLAVSGKAGTLRNSFQHELLQNTVYAKTGYILGVRALSGYIKTKDNETLAFSFIMNKDNSRINKFFEITEEILVELINFEREPGNDEDEEELLFFDRLILVSDEEEKENELQGSDK